MQWDFASSLEITPEGCPEKIHMMNLILGLGEFITLAWGGDFVGILEGESLKTDFTCTKHH